jgi:nitrate reductase NapE component
MPAPSSYSIPATPVVAATPAPASHVAENKTFPAQASDFSPAPASTPAQEFVSEGTSGNHLVPILVVTLVAILAIAVVGYFAYVLFK